jgi:hypothetical protein
MANASSPPHNIGSWALWFGFFGGIVAWAIFLMSGFAVAYVGCLWGLETFRSWLFILTGVFGIIAIIGTVVAFRNRQRADSETDEAHANETGANETGAPLGRVRFMTVLSAWLSLLSVMLILMTAISIIWMTPCG